MRPTLPREPLNESGQEFGARLRAAATWIDDNHNNVEELCKEMPQRMRDPLYVTKGGRLNK